MSAPSREEVIAAYVRHLDSQVENVKFGRQPQQSDEASEAASDHFILEINYLAQFSN